MNTRLLSLVRSNAASASRAQFSPLAPRFTQLSLRQTAAASSILRAPGLTTPTFASSLALVGGSFAGRLWTPGLLDRLQSPLTRYRE